MDELPLGIQQKLRALPGAENGVQVVDLVLEDGRVAPEVRVVDCAYVADESFEAHLVADVRLPAAPPRPLRAVIFFALVLGGIFVMFYLLRQLVPK